MGSIKIIYDKKKCIGAGECEKINRELWRMGPDSKATLKDAVLNPGTGTYELVLDDTQLKQAERAARSCPAMGAIKVVKL
jgi:ferredoxin